MEQWGWTADYILFCELEIISDETGIIEDIAEY